MTCPIYTNVRIRHSFHRSTANARQLVVYHLNTAVNKLAHIHSPSHLHRSHNALLYSICHAASVSLDVPASGASFLYFLLL